MYSLTETRCVRHKVALPSHGEQSPVDHNLPLVGEASGQHSLRASKLAVPQQHPREFCLTASCHTTLVDQRNLSFSSMFAVGPFHPSSCGDGRKWLWSEYVPPPQRKKRVGNLILKAGVSGVCSWLLGFWAGHMPENEAFMAKVR